MAKVAIIGGGLCGLSCALFSARRGHQVILLEHDLRPPDDGPDTAFSWRRRGVPHARQGHLFLGLSTRIMRQEAPDVIDAILAHGAIEVPVGMERNSAATILARRLIYEAAFHRVVEVEERISFRHGVTVTGLVAERIGSLTTIQGVTLSDGSRVEADLVVDAAGRMSRCEHWLRTICSRPISDVSYHCSFLYLTRHYRVATGRSFPEFELPAAASFDYGNVVIFPADNGVFSISIVLSAKNPCRKLLSNDGVYDRFLSEVPLAAPWIRAGEPLDRPSSMAGFVNRHRRLVDAQGPLIGGFVLAGDAAMQISPTLGRGVSLALASAQRLAQQLDSHAADPAVFVEEFDAWINEHLGIWFKSQVAEDNSLDRRLANSLDNRETGALDDPAHQVITALGELRKTDMQVRDASDRAFNLLITPDELLRNRYLLRSINKYLNAHWGRSVVAPGPTKLEFERLCGISS